MTSCRASSKLYLSSEIPDLSGKVVYQRVRHALSPQSDVLFHDALTIEERIRFLPDPDRDGYLLPIGRRTLILLDKNAKELYRMNVHERKSTHNGFDRDLDSTITMILYLASNPKVLKGRVLELESQLGIGGLLGAIALSGVLGQDVEGKPEDDDILPNKEKFHVHLPPNVEKLTLTDANAEMLNLAFLNVKKSGLAPHEVVLQELDWTKHPKISDDTRFDVILGCDLLFSYPTAKELARTAAWMLGPEGTFLHICPDNREDLSYLRRFLEKGYRMTATPGYLKLQTHEYKFQLLDEDEEETKLDSLELVEQSVRESTFESLLAFHHPDYDGINGEYFFPMETGAYDARIQSTYLEPERRDDYE
jgi:SAM-dependent methyltransferase